MMYHLADVATAATGATCGGTGQAPCHITYIEAIVSGIVQGVSELFPISSLGHNVLLPALIGGNWGNALNVSAPNSPYLAFIVGLHVATAVAMIAYFWRDWLRIIGGLISSIRSRSVSTPDERLAWMIILATIPVGLAGLVLQKEVTKVFAKPELTAVFLAVNGVILLMSERMRRRREEAGSASGMPRMAEAARPAFGGPAGGPPRGYSQQPRQQQWQGPPRNGEDDWGRDPRGNGQYGRGQRGNGQQRDGRYEQGQYGNGRHGRGQYDQGQHGQGQHGRGQYDQDQYGQGRGQDQYDQGQYGQDQYGRGQRGNGQQRDGRYEQGQYGDSRRDRGQYDQGQYEQGQHGRGQYGQDQYGQGQRGNGQQRDGRYEQGQYGQDQYGEPDPWASQARQQGQDPWGRQDHQAGQRAADPRSARGPRGAEWQGGGHGTRPAEREEQADHAVVVDRRLSTMGYKRAVIIGSAQILALMPGISRDGIVIVAGMWRGIRREDAVRFSFLLSAPIILAAGVLKMHDLTGPLSAGEHGPMLVGALLAGICAYLSVRFLMKYFSEDKSLNPFGIYCIVAGVGSLAYLLIR